MPLDGLRSKKLPDIGTLNRVLGPEKYKRAIDCLYYDSKHAKAMELAFGGVVICGDTETAKVC